MAGVAEFEQRVELVFHNIQYILTVEVANGDTLCIEAEQKSDGGRWRGDFTASYIEDIAQKTGSFKKFAVFVRMLRSAILQESESVFVDLLTYQDLELLKSRKGRGMGQPPRPPSNNKRYLILTYNSEFDRVHYPLPLLYEENPEPEALKATIRRLRDELEEMRASMLRGRSDFSGGGGSGSTARGGGRVRGHPGAPTDGSSGSETERGGGGAELLRLQVENERLKAKLREVNGLRDSSGKENGRYPNQSPRNNGSLSEDEGEARRELALLRKDRDSLAARLEGKDAELARLRPEAIYGEKLSRTHRERGKELEKLRRQLEQAEEDVRGEKASNKRALTRLSKENSLLAEQLAHTKDSERRLRVKVRELESELDLFRRRANSLASRDVPPLRSRPTTLSRGASPTSMRAISSRTTSRNPSPASSRGTSPPMTRRPSHTGSLPNSRPNSAPSAFRRFDPTAYVKEKALKDEQLRTDARLRGGGGGARVKTSQTRYTSPTARSPDLRVRQPSPSTNRFMRTTAAQAGKIRSAGQGSQPVNRPGSTGRRASYSSSPERPWRSDVESAPALRGRGGGGAHAPPRDGVNANSGSAWTSEDEAAESGGGGSRGSSPARALRHVKAKLAKFARNEGLERVVGSRGASATDERKRDDAAEQGDPPHFEGLRETLPVAPDDASAEIADIDSRLHALQNFLKAAKGSGGASDGIQ